MRTAFAIVVLMAGSLLSACDNARASPEDVSPPDERATWSNRAPLPDLRTEVSVTTDGARLYLIGGFGPGGGGGSSAEAPRRMWIYDATTDEWTAAGDIPEGVNHAGFVHVAGRLYIVGGFREASFTPTGAVRIYDIASGQWSEGAPMPTPRGAAAVLVADGRIHVIGGNVSSPGAVHEHERADVTADNSVNTHEVYDPVADSWSRLDPMSTSRNHLGGVALGGRIHVVGGRSNSDFELTVHEIFDPASGAWTSGPAIPTGRSGIAVVERGGMMYVFGGEAGRGTFNEAERFDPVAGRWENLPPMPTARHGLGAAVLSGNIHVVSGGPQPGMRFSDAHEVLSPD